MRLRGVQLISGRAAWLAVSVLLGAAASAPSAGAQAVAAASPSAAAMQSAVHGLRACLVDISPADRRVLILRFGVGGRPHQSDQAVASQLGTNAAAVAARELVVVKQLASVHGGAACAAAQRVTKAPVVATADSSAAATQPATRPADTGSIVSTAHGSGGLGADGAMLIVLIAACLCVVAYEFRKALFSPPPRR